MVNLDNTKMNREQDLISLKDICRICLSKSAEMKSLLVSTQEVGDIKNKLYSVLNYEIKINDILPATLCRDCERRLNIAYEFQKLGQKSQLLLSDYITRNGEGYMKNSNSNSLIINDKNIHLVDLCSQQGNEQAFSSESSINLDDLSDDTKDNQTMRLNQYSAEEVEKVIIKVREKHIKESKCIHCKFEAKDSRALSVHMSRLHKNKRNSWCSLCNTECENLTQHMQTDHTDDFKCPFCFKISTKTSHFIEHLSSHTKRRKFTCSFCTKSFISARHLRMHQKVHSKNLKCHICDREFLFKKSLRLHLKTHFAYNCKVCEIGFLNTEDYESHKCLAKDESANRRDEIDKSDKIILQPQNYCKQCDKRVRSLEKHLESHHSNIKELKPIEKSSLCPYCGKQFRFLSKLSIHLRCHTGETPYKCSYCDMRLSTRGHLVVHERTHTGEKPHICSICGKAFSQTSILNTHMKLHTGRPIACMLCPKRFCRPSELRQHMRIHSGEKPYSCTQCGSSFNQRSHLVEHSRTHNNDRPYQCEYCDKRFKKMSTLKIHANVHTVEKQGNCLVSHKEEIARDDITSGTSHKCAVCLESFATVALFTAHYTSNHQPLTVSMDVEIRTTFIDGVEPGDETSPQFEG